MNQQQAGVAIAGTDSWLRRHVFAALHQRGAVADVGPGTSYFRGVDTLVVIPALVPSSGDPERDVGARGLRVTLAAATAAAIGRVVIVSRLGVPGSGGYLGALGALEAYIAGQFKKVTSVRLSHPFGELGDEGPVVEALQLLGAERSWEAVKVQPIHVADAAAVVASAAAGDFGNGIIDAGGPEVMTLEAFRAATGAIGKKPRRARRAAVNATNEFFAADSRAGHSHAEGGRTVGATWSGVMR